MKLLSERKHFMTHSNVLTLQLSRHLGIAISALALASCGGGNDATKSTTSALKHNHSAPLSGAMSVIRPVESLASAQTASDQTLSGDLDLSDLVPDSAISGWGPWEKDTSNGERISADGKPLTINGTVYPKGLGVHADSEIVYRLDGRCSRFTADIGVDDETGGKGSVIFAVKADSDQVFVSGVVRGRTPAEQVDVDLKGKNELRLIVTSGGDGYSYDHADWSAAKLTCDPIVDAPAARWSDPATWGGTLPPAGGSVVIPAGKSIVLDVPVDLAALQIEGQLRFDPATDVELRAGSIMLTGSAARLSAGSVSAPHPSRATITLTGARTDAADMHCGSKALCVMGGTLELFGEPRLSWTRLAASANAGTTQLSLADSPNWRPGDEIVIAPSGVNPFEAERRTVTAVDGRQVTLDKTLAFAHYGKAQTFDGVAVETRAEVGLLTRNVVVRGDDASATDGFGAHVMVMAGAKAYVSDIELYRAGQKGLVGRYPFHWHMAGDVSGQYVKNSSIHSSYNRFLTIHGSSGALVQNNTAYDTIGHGYYLEDGVETKNVLQGNLGILVRQAKEGEEVRPQFQWPAFVKSDRMPAVFWMSHPDNIVRNNVAAGAENGFGFWLSYFEVPTGLSAGSAVRPRTGTFGEFSGNLAHSISKTGVRDADYSFQGSGLMIDAYEGSKPARIDNLTVYNVNTMGAWATDSVFTRFKVLDTPWGLVPGGNVAIQDSLFVGRSDNYRLEGAFDDQQNFLDTAASFGLSPHTQDTGLDLRNSRFINYPTNSNGPDGRSTTAAITHRHFHLDAAFTMATTRFINSQPFQLRPEAVGEVTGRVDRTRWDDLDGSVSGTPATYLGYGSDNDSSNCRQQSNWLAYICPLLR